MHEVGFEPTSANTSDLKSDPLDQLGHSCLTKMSYFLSNSGLLGLTGIRTQVCRFKVCCDNHLHYKTFGATNRNRTCDLAVNSRTL